MVGIWHDLGDIAPGTSSVAVPLTTPSASYHCTIHPSMVGTIGGDVTPLPPPQEEPPTYYSTRGRR